MIYSTLSVSPCFTCFNNSSSRGISKRSPIFPSDARWSLPGSRLVQDGSWVKSLLFMVKHGKTLFSRIYHGHMICIYDIVCMCVCAYILEIYLSFRQTQFLLAQESQEPSHFSSHFGVQNFRVAKGMTCWAYCRWSLSQRFIDFSGPSHGLKYGFQWAFMPTSRSLTLI